MLNKVEKPDVSVIVPVYNVEKYLRSCLDSLAHQTLKTIEVIMVNDGSTDSSAEIASEFEKIYTHFRLISRENGGLSEARNTGIKHARGEYIGFVDSDDFVDHTMYEILYNTAINKRADIVKSGVLLFDDGTGNIQDLRQTEEPAIIHNSPGEALTAFLEKRMNIVVVNGVYARDIFNDLTFVAGVKYEDHYFTPNALIRCKRFVQINDVHYYYRKRQGSLTGGTDPKGRADKVQSLNELYRVLRETGRPEAYSKLYAEYFIKMATDYHNSVAHTAPMRLRKGYFALQTLIEPEIIRFVLSKGYLSDTNRSDLRLISRSHWLFFLRQKLNRLFEIVSGVLKDSNEMKKRGLDTTNKDLQLYQKYIERYR
jgi:glycosyltransferase involved in cell wall biosynthesis